MPRNRNIIRKNFALILLAGALFFPFLKLKAQKLSVQVSSTKVQAGVPFQIAFTINAGPSSFTPPSFKDFDVYSGPNQSQSVQYINGSMSQSFTFSYLIAAKKEGKLVIDPATVVVGGQNIQSNSITIEAVKGNAGQNQQQAQQGNIQQQQSQQDDPAFSTKVTGEDLFIRTSISKTKAYLGEQVTVVQKVYSRLELRGFQNVKYPSYNGFWSQQAEGNHNIQLQVENIDGVNYYVGEFSRTYVFPQRSGKLTIEPTELECVVRKQTNKKPRNIFEQFFGTGGYEDVSAKAKSKPVSIEIIDLPQKNKPENFSGAVGNFTYKVEARKRSIKANEAFNLKITLSGKGNIKLIDAPKLNLPESFETYDPKINENINNNGGISGTKTFDYLIIPREAGEFTISGLNFAYFNPENKDYINIPSPEVTISVSAGDAKSNAGAQVYEKTKQEIKETENDIRYIKKGDFYLQKKDQEFFNSSPHLFLLALSVLLFSGGLFYRSFYLKQNSNITLVNQRKAAKVAKKQLVKVEKFMKENNKEEFYTEVMKALNNYLSHKFDIPFADLSKEKITEKLNYKKITSETQQKLFDTLNQCEFAKYAPSAVSGDLNLVYNNTIDLISSVENEIKNA